MKCPNCKKAITKDNIETVMAGYYWYKCNACGTRFPRKMVIRRKRVPSPAPQSHSPLRPVQTPPSPLSE